jgi:hypothetical protein
MYNINLPGLPDFSNIDLSQFNPFRRPGDEGIASLVPSGG